MTDHLDKLLREARKTLRNAIEADNKGKRESALENYNNAFKQFDHYREEFDKEYYLPYYKRPKEIEGGLIPESSTTDTPQIWRSPTYSSPKFVKLSNVELDDVAGLEECKQVLMEAAIWPKKYPQFFTGNRKPWRTVLLFGPPGSGKTLLAKAIAAKARFKFCRISPSNIVSKWMGDSEQQVSDLFQKAREEKPSIIFFDEFDSLCGPRGKENENEASRRIKSELLVHMQDVCDGKEHVLILAATNTPYALDQAIRRRFDMRIYIPLPNEKARKRIFEIEIGKTPSTIVEKDLERLAEETEGFSGSDISSYVKDALYHSIRATLREEFFIEIEDKVWVPCPNAGVSQKKKSLPQQEKKSLRQLEELNKHSQIQVPKITLADFKEVKKRHKPTVNETDLKLLKKFEEEFGVSGEM